jgi:hypothetical protein
VWCLYQKNNKNKKFADKYPIDGKLSNHLESSREAASFPFPAFPVYPYCSKKENGVSAVIWTSQITPTFCIQGFSKVRNSMKQVSLVEK